MDISCEENNEHYASIPNLWRTVYNQTPIIVHCRNRAETRSRSLNFDKECLVYNTNILVGF